MDIPTILDYALLICPAIPNCPLCLPGSQTSEEDPQICIKCPPQCGSCLNGSCLACFDGYYLEENQCKSCPAKCRTCTDSFSCSVCELGYTLALRTSRSPSDCLKCSHNCLTCMIQPHVCLSCGKGKTLKFMRCINQYSIAFQYRLADSYTDFLQKSKSQKLVEELRATLKANQQDFMVTSISSGSTLFEGVYSSASMSSATSDFQILKAYKLTQFEVIASSFAFLNETQTPQKCTAPNCQEPPPPTDVGLIVGLVMAIATSVIVILVVAIIHHRNAIKYGSQSADNLDSAGPFEKTAQAMQKS